MTKTTKAIIIISAAVLLLAIIVIAIVALVKKNGADIPDPGSVTTPATATQTEAETQPTVVPVNPGEIFRITPDETVAVSGVGSTYDLYVANDVTYLKMYDYIIVPEGIEWTIATDAEMQQTVPSKTVVLKEGNTTFYVLCTNADQTISETYVLQVHRTEHCIIAFEGLTAVQELEAGELATPPTETPVKEGCTFVGWDFDFSVPVRASVTVNALWQYNTYTVNFDPDGGELDARSQKVVFGEPVALPAPTKEGYTFMGWTYRGETVVSGPWPIAADVTLKALWESNIFTVTFDAAGGMITGESLIQVAFGENVAFPTPIRDGFIFDGWYSGDVRYVSGPFTYTQDLNLVAHWNANAADMTFFPNGGTMDSLTALLAEGDPLPVPTRAGFTFGGWFRDVELSEEVLSVPGNPTKLFAWWTEEGKPSEFIYETKRDPVTKLPYYSVTARLDPSSTSLVPQYIAGIRTVNDIDDEADPNAGVVLENEILEVHVGRTVTVHATFTPRHPGDDTNLTYTTSNPAVATVDQSGVVTGIAQGQCIVTVTNPASDLYASCIINVESGGQNPAAKLTFSQDTYTVQIGKPFDLPVIYVPEYEGDALVLKYSSENESIAKVDKKGNVTGMTEGTCHIYVADGYGKSAECTVIVVPAYATLTVSTSSVTLEIGASETVKAEYEPANLGDDTTLTWKSGDESVATVVDGVITGVSEGVTVVTVSNADGSCSKTVSVAVSEPDQPTEPDTPTEQDQPTVQDHVCKFDPDLPNDTEDLIAW